METIGQVNRLRNEARVILAPVAAALLLSAVGCSQNKIDTSLPEGSVVIDMSHQTTGIDDTDSMTIDLEDIGLEESPDGEAPNIPNISSSDHTMTGTYGKLASIQKIDDKIVLIDESPRGMSDDIKEWFAKSIETNGTVIETAFKTGSLKNIIIGIENDYNTSHTEHNDGDSQALKTGFFEDADNTVVVNFTSNNPRDLDKASTEQLILHETLHSLFKNSEASVFNENTIPSEVQKNFMNACASLRTSAAKAFNDNSWQLALPIRTLSVLENDTAMRQRFEAMAINFAKGTALKTATPFVNAEGNNISECKFPSFAEIGVQTAKENGLPEPNRQTRDFSRAAMNQYYSLETGVSEILRDESPYSVVTESNYLDREFDNMGHPYENLDELAASTVNILISFPDEFAENIKDLPEDQQDAVIAVVRTVVDEIARTNPELANFMHEREATLMEAIRR